LLQTALLQQPDWEYEVLPFAADAYEDFFNKRFVSKWHTICDWKYLANSLPTDNCYMITQHSGEEELENIHKDKI
jgi:hypothetical protein